MGYSNLTAFPDGMELWNLNYTVNMTFRTEQIFTIKEVHCEVKKCDPNTFAAVGGEFYIDKPTDSRTASGGYVEQLYHGDLGSVTRYTCADVALSVVTENFLLKCIENKYYDTDEIRGVWIRQGDSVDPGEGIELDRNRVNIGCTVQECYEIQGDRYEGTVPTLSPPQLERPYQAFNDPTLNSYSWAQADTMETCY